MRIYFDFDCSVYTDKEVDGSKLTDIDFTVIPTVTAHYGNYDYKVSEHFKEAEKWWTLSVRLSWLVFDFSIVVTSRPRRDVFGKEGEGEKRI